jgi:hypothetical protein
MKDNKQQYGEAMKAAPMLAREGEADAWPASDMQKAHIRRRLQEDLRKNDDEKAKEIMDAKDTPEYEQTKGKSTYMAKLARHNLKARKLGINAVKDVDGTPILNRHAAYQYLGEYWGEKFKEKSIDEEGALEFTTFWSS